MEMFEISTYLQGFSKETRRGFCKVCQKPVQWSRTAVSSHKRASCGNATAEEKRRFAKRSNADSNAVNFSDNLNGFEGFDVKYSGDNDKWMGNRPQDSSWTQPLDTSWGQWLSPDCPNCQLTEEQVKNINFKVGNFFHRAGISFRLAESEAFKDLIRSLNPAYANLLPDSSQLAGPLIDQQYRTCSKRLQEILDESFNLTLVTDGWTDTRGDHVVNFCVKAPGQKPIFYKAINTFGSIQSVQSVVVGISSVIDQLGPAKFSCVITDSGAIMRAAHKILEAKYRLISAYSSSSYGVHLLIKDILDTPENSKTTQAADTIIKFIVSHHIVKAKYESRRKSVNVPNTLSTAAATSRFTSLKNLLTSKYVLLQLVDEDETSLQEISPTAASETVLRLIKSNGFWESLAKLVKVIEHPANVIDKLEADDAPLSLVYHSFGELFNHYEYDKALQDKVKSRLKFVYTGCMGLAFMLTPQYTSSGFYFDEDRIDILIFAKAFAMKINPETAAKAYQQLLDFAVKISTQTKSCEQLIFDMGPKNYWRIHRSDFPELFEIAKLLILEDRTSLSVHDCEEVEFKQEDEADLYSENDCEEIEFKPTISPTILLD